MLRLALILLGLLDCRVLAFNRLPEGQEYEVVFPQKLHALYKRDTQSMYPDMIQYEIHLDGNATVIHIEKTEGLFADNYTESHYLEDGTLVTSSPEYQDHCYYQGHVKHDKDSVVTISTCSGLSGVIQTRERSFFIEPLKFTDIEEHAVFEAMEVSNKTCGVSGTRPSQKPPTIISFRASDAEKENLLEARKYIELVMVADESMFTKYDSNLQTVKQRLLDILNFVNKVYKSLNIFVAVIGIEIWSRGNQIQVVSDVDILLSRFVEWRTNTLLPRKPHDNAQFITHVDFNGDTVGYAAMSVMCELHSAGIIQDFSKLASFVGATVAHEMGHNLGIPHDVSGCTCGANACVMSPGISFEIPLKFTDCSIRDMKQFLYNRFPVCILNLPDMSQLLSPPLCGNKFIDSGEQCDCGEPQECKSDCCDAYTCSFKPGYECDEGMCCRNCKVKPAGSICRPAKDECDIADMCDGKSSVCTKDSFKTNGSPCMDGKGACYRGKCPVMNNQCAAIWGPQATAGKDVCFSTNLEGSLAGHCKKEGTIYIPCEKANIKCGLLFCMGGEKTPNVRGPVGGYDWCKTVVFTDGLVSMGTKCSDTNVCLDGKCVNMENSYMTAGCEAKCPGNAVCDHDLQCQCKEGWAPPDCVVYIEPETSPAASVLHLFSSSWWWPLQLFSVLVSVC